MCIIEGCLKKVRAKGFCQKHYMRLRVHGDPTKTLINREFVKCKSEECLKKSVSKGYCDKHYRRFKKHGHTNEIKRKGLSGENSGKYKHGLSGTREYSSWKEMIRRCYREDNIMYHLYGGRGIKVCDDWLGDKGPVNFLKDMGPRPKGFSIDRIDTNGDYEPSNCRWASAKTQARNPTTCKLNKEKVLHILEMHEKGVKGKDISEMYNVAPDTVYSVLSGKNWA